MGSDDLEARRKRRRNELWWARQKRKYTARPDSVATELLRRACGHAAVISDPGANRSVHDPKFEKLA